MLDARAPLSASPPASATRLRRICVYCGSGPGSDPAYAEAARALGTIMAARGIGLVYGGGTVGLMGEIAGAIESQGGETLGIIPRFLVGVERTNGHGRLVVTADMHERKRRMFEEADAFVALPGGPGTLEELVEQITWAQLGRHKKPILLANIQQFWNPLLALLDHMRATRFIRPAYEFNLLVADRVEDIVPMIEDALARVSEGEKDMAPHLADKM